MMDTIWIINQYASHLVTRHEELSKYFASQGYRVAVITFSFHHGRRAYIYEEPIVYNEFRNGLFYIYIHSAPFYQNNGVRRFFNMIDFCYLIWKYKNEILEKTGIPRFIIASSAPPFVWEIGYKVAKKFKAKFIAEFRDIWPMSLVDILGISPKHPLVQLLSIIEKRAYKRADAIVSTMPYAWKHVLEVANVPLEKVHWIPNGINVREFEDDLKSELRLPEDLEKYLTEHWCCVYIGSIVRCECLDCLLKGFSKVKDDEIYFAVIGDGNEKENIQKLATDLGISNIKFFPAINRHLIPKALNLAAAAAAAHEDLPVYQYGLSMNKLSDYLASGKPTIFACNVPSIVKDAKHFTISTHDEQVIANTIEKIKHLDKSELELLRESAIVVIRNDYDYSEIGKKYLMLMEELREEEKL